MQHPIHNFIDACNFNKYNDINILNEINKVGTNDADSCGKIM